MWVCWKLRMTFILMNCIIVTSDKNICIIYISKKESSQASVCMNCCAEEDYSVIY